MTQSRPSGEDVTIAVRRPGNQGNNTTYVITDFKHRRFVSFLSILWAGGSVFVQRAKLLGSRMMSMV